MESTQFAHGVEQPTALGIAGGEPGSLHGFAVVRGGRDLAARRPEQLPGAVDMLPPKGTVQLTAEDVFVHYCGGGGGLGDPLERPADEVANDVAGGLVTVGAAARDYAVVVAHDGSVDLDATAAMRAAERGRRLGRTPDQPGAVGTGRRLSRHAVLAGDVCSCAHCGRAWGRLGDALKRGLLLEEVPVAERWPQAAPVIGIERFVIRRFRCPGCATQVDTEVNLVGAPFVSSFDVW
jgi:N-methylhydantoinase B